MNVDTQRLTAGVEGVKKLAKAWLSARYLEAALRGWGEDLVCAFAPKFRRRSSLCVVLLGAVG